MNSLPGPKNSRHGTKDLAKWATIDSQGVFVGLPQGLQAATRATWSSEQSCATGCPLRRPKTTERPEYQASRQLFVLWSWGESTHRNLSRASVWTADARGFNDVCLTGTPVSVWWCAFCATKCATRRRTIWRCGGRRLVGTCDSYDVVLTTLSNSDRDSSVGNRLTENEKRIHSCPA